jgi:hypothetical protein
LAKPQAFTFATLQKYILYLESYSLPFLFNGFITLFQEAKPYFNHFSFSTYKINKLPLTPTALPHFVESNRPGYVEVADPLDHHVWNVYFTILSRLNEDGDELDISNGRIVFNSSNAPYTNQLTQLDQTIDRIQELFEEAISTLTVIVRKTHQR